jgi:hypothetical protein
MELSYNEIRDLAKGRTYRKLDKVTALDTVLIALMVIAAVVLVTLVVIDGITKKNFDGYQNKIVYQIPAGGELVITDNLVTLDNMVIQPTNKFEYPSNYLDVDGPKYIFYGAACLGFISCFIYILAWLYREDTERHKLMTYYFEHKEFPKEEA